MWGELAAALILIVLSVLILALGIQKYILLWGASKAKEINCV